MCVSTCVSTHWDPSGDSVRLRLEAGRVRLEPAVALERVGRSVRPRPAPSEAKSTEEQTGGLGLHLLHWDVGTVKPKVQGLGGVLF
jgi:hypothetical protein